MSDLKIAIIVGSTRPGRNAGTVGAWVAERAQRRTDATFEVVDVASFGLPVLDEPVPAAMGQYQNAHTKTWAAKIAEFDGYVFVTPEYNHSIPGALKNALDYLYAEWNNKAAGMVSYGSAGGARAAEHLRTILAELQIATVRGQVMFSLATDFENYSTFTPAERHDADLATLLDQTVSWSTALRSERVAA